jgi:hypothetical protein
MISHYSADTETYSFSSGNIAPRLVCSSWSHNLGTPYLLDRNDTYDHVVTLLAGTEPLVWYNAAFDASVLVANWPHLFDHIYEAYEDGRIRCVLIREALYQLFMGQLKDHRGDLSLANTYQRRTGKMLQGKKGGEHDWRLRFGELEGVPISAYPKEASDYALQDATSAGEIFLQQNDLPDEKNQTKAAFALYLMACTGIRANPKKVAALRGKLEQRISLASEVLIPTGIYRPSGKRNMAVIKGMVAQAYTAVGKSIPYVVPKGKKAPDPDKKPNISYAAEVLKDLPCVGEECDDYLFRVCDHPLHWLKSATEDAGELSKYVKHLEHACKAPLNYTVTSLVATGRTAISNPPLQQLPRRHGVRQCIEPPPGHYFVGADYAALELTTLGQILLDYFGTSLLAETIQKDRDPHLMTGAMFMGISYEEAVRRLKEEKSDTWKGEKPVSDMRQLGKILNFGAPGGLSAPTFVVFAKGYGYKFKGKEEEQIETARGFLREYKNWYPEIKRYLDLVAKQVDHGGGYFDLVQPRSKRIRGQVGYTNGANCVDAETEALSKTRGWVKGFDLVVGEEILTKNPVTMALEWQPIQHLHLYPDYAGPIIEFRSRAFHAVTTPNHKWLCTQNKPAKVVERTSQNISRFGDDRIHRTGQYEGNSKWSDDFVELCGWFLTDGSHKKWPNGGTVCLYQSWRTNPQKVKRIDALLTRLGVSHHRAVRTESDVVWTLHVSEFVSDVVGLLPGRVISQDLLLGLSRDQARLLVDTMIAGDGTYNGNLRVLCCRDEQRVRQFQALCMLAGFASSYRKHFPRPGGRTGPNTPNIVQAKNPYYLVSVLGRDQVQVVQSQVSEWSGPCPVWCPTVENGTFVARRSGTTYITKNSTFQGLAADLCKDAIWHITRECFRPGTGLFGSRVVLFMHDEVILQSPKELAHLAGDRLSVLMLEAAKRWAPDVPTKAEPWISLCWEKEAKSVRDNNGKLLPWIPKE